MVGINKQPIFNQHQGQLGFVEQFTKTLIALAQTFFCFMPMGNVRGKADQRLRMITHFDGHLDGPEIAVIAAVVGQHFFRRLLDPAQVHFAI